MLVKILGAIDVLIGLILLFRAEVKLHYLIFLILGVILLVKSALGLLKYFTSWIDFSCGIFLILSSITIMHIIISIIFGILIMQRGIFSFLG